jgi:hypothetical protein
MITPSVGSRKVCRFCGSDYHTTLSHHRNMRLYHGCECTIYLALYPSSRRKTKPEKPYIDIKQFLMLSYRIIQIHRHSSPRRFMRMLVASDSDCRPSQLCHSKMSTFVQKRSVPSDFITSNGKNEPQVLWIGCSESECTETRKLKLQANEIVMLQNMANMYFEDQLSCSSIMDYALLVLKVSYQNISQSLFAFCSVATSWSDMVSNLVAAGKTRCCLWSLWL